jgi:hypothetical protein
VPLVSRANFAGYTILRLLGSAEMGEVSERTKRNGIDQSLSQLGCPPEVACKLAQAWPG